MDPVIAAGLIAAGSTLIGTLGTQALAYRRERNAATQAESSHYERQVWERRRQVLDDGAALLRRMMGVWARVDINAEGNVTNFDEVREALEAVGGELAAHGARVQVWFPPDSEIVDAWEEAGAMILAKRRDLIDGALQRYGAAARAFLVTDAPT